MIELVNDGIELRDPRFGAGIEVFLARLVERLIAESRQREREEVLQRARAERDDGRLGDEPFRAAGDALRRAVAPEVIARFARRKRQTVAGGKRAFRVRAARPREHKDIGDVDERQRGHFGHDVLHQQRKALGVVDHATAGHHCTIVRTAHTVPTEEAALAWHIARPDCI